MNTKAAGVLLALLLAIGCTAAPDEVASRDEPAHSPLPAVVTAPAGGLWSHRFVAWSDGSVTAVGFSRQPAGIGLVHFAHTGELDPSLPRVVRREFGAGKLDALAVARAGRGAFFIAGCQPPDCWGYFVLGRFLRDGSRDPAFGNDGLVRTSVHGAALEPRAIALQRDGKIVVAGELSAGSSRQGFLARYLADGSADVRFGSAGVLVTDLAWITAVAVQPDGRIVAAGHRVNARARPASSTVEVVRYLAAGNRDAHFGSGGTVRGLALSYARTLVIDRLGRILVAGSALRGHRPFFAVARLTAAGMPDSAFGNHGHIFHRRSGDYASGVEALTPLPKGGLAVTGWAVRGNSVRTRRYRLVVVVLRSSGKRVRSFGEDGRVTLGRVEAKPQAALLRQPQRLTAIGADDDLEPRRVVFATIPLPR